MVPINYSILDLGIKADIDNDAKVFKRLAREAKCAEQLGYERFWIAEHHNSEFLVCSATTIVMSYLASKTKSIRLGSGGIMLPNHKTLMVAEQFGTLETLCPGRIDLGVGRGPGGDKPVSNILSYSDLNSFSLKESVIELQSYFSVNERSTPVRSFPGEGLKVPIWILGTSVESAEIAGYLGLPYVFGAHLTLLNMNEASQVYHESFRQSEQTSTPYFTVCLNVIAAASEAEADHLSNSYLNMMAGTFANRIVPFSRPTERLIYKGNKLIEDKMYSVRSRLIVGDKEIVTERISEIVTSTRANEVMVTNYVYDKRKRIECYHYISEAIAKMNRVSG